MYGMYHAAADLRISNSHMNMSVAAYQLSISLIK